MGFFKKAKRFVLPTIGAVIGSALLPGVGTALGASIGSAGGAAIGSGLGTLAAGGSIKDALLSGVGSYGGSVLGSSLGNAVGAGSIGEALGAANAYGPQFVNTGLGSVLGNTAANSLGAMIGNASIGGTLGSIAGSYAAQNSFGGSMEGPAMATNAAPLGPAPFKPTRESEMQAPTSIKGMGSLTPEQQSTNIATQGVYGGGAGPEEQRYFMNLMNRRLVDESGKLGQMSAIAPIEQGYLSRLGLGGYGDVTSLLEAMNKWKAA